MSVLVYTENWDGKFKKLSFELISYANEIAKKLNSTVVALSIGNVAEDELKLLGNYGATKVLSVVHDKIKGLDNQVFTSIIAQAVEKEKSTVVVFAHNNTGKAIAPRLSVRLKAGLVAGVTAVPASFKPFTVVKKVFTSKALSTVVVNTPVQIVTLLQNTYGIIETATPVVVEAFHPQIQDAEFTTDIKEVSKVTGKILLTDAEIVVSGGRGMKGPENWGVIEELASLLGAATACSRPVSDEGWRPHDEHTGQTGKVIAPNLYIAAGISGAIQHLGGVSGSKCIVAINKDPDAPIFEAADYGIVGDVLKVLPEMIAAVKELKNS
ncbi:MAG: electron transfer flavoprotein subunit alpha [Bacteroidetes bacterium RIFOXYA12_FULL_35_11]|nr:MAG: electron transfer flavoprotein subunit alpha [Bacteroidetes bacterium GWF2_35_48]OFY78834.1 MAG: electron transfer flavoprotein subunit alpha [Bacteroidetes bacterium RIFOXYA12_FULL_35_11]OFZ06532.1 MAG: electron transfer flavoprotein subunit alpha [Bacteroidetes bacterium RIFOXYC12_FULL_35_7]HBX50321.1 electron transfer flavoprotein subunit alpha [Bacteroidales bacterium]